MNPRNFFIPRYIGMRNLPFSASTAGTISPMVRNAGLFSKITNGLRSFNWSGLLNNANKTLNVVNQAIPLVRQAGPMVSNMRSMLKIAKVFGNETTNKTNLNHNLKNNDKIDDNKDKDLIINASIENKEVDNNYPNFFV